MKSQALSPDALLRIDAICDRFEAVLKTTPRAADRPRIEALVGGVEAVEERRALLVELLALEAAYRRKWGEPLDAGEYAARFPEAKDLVRAIVRDAAKASVLAPGTKIDHYEIAELIGRGGMGEVYRARDLKLFRDVAVKVLRGPLAKDQVAIHRFEHEARALAALSHPNVLAIFDFGRARGLPFFVMELLEGETMRSRLARGAIDAKWAIEIGVALADGLSSAHAKGIVHRDLKPQNVFLPSCGGLKILDFGLAMAHGTGDEAPERQAVGSERYMAPEQRAMKAVDARADLYALGCILSELGAPALEPIASRCKQECPDDRFASAQAVREALAAAGLRLAIDALSPPPRV